jgi:hypothetical protein
MKIEGFNGEGMDCFCRENIMSLTIKKFNSSLKRFNRNSIAERKMGGKNFV